MLHLFIEHVHTQAVPADTSTEEVDAVGRRNLALERMTDGWLTARVHQEVTG